MADEVGPARDPSLATNEAVERAARAERDYVDGQLGEIRERLRGIDTATELLNETVNRVPNALTEGLGHLQAVMDERFNSINKQFAERDTRSERESRDNKVAVDAAFAAQKEAASEQNKSNTLAISKSETATAETINKLAELVRTQIAAMADKIDDLKERVGRIESIKQGGVEVTADRRANLSSSMTLIGTIVAIIIVGLALLSYSAGHRADGNTPVVTVQIPTTTTP